MYHVSTPDKSLYVRHNDVRRRQLGIRFQELFFGLLAVDQRTDLVVSILSERMLSFNELGGLEVF